MSTATDVLCRHAEAVPVESAVTGATLAYLCPVCDTQLSESFGAELVDLRALMARQDACGHTGSVADITAWGVGVIASRCQDCGKPLTPARSGGSDQ